MNLKRNPKTGQFESSDIETARYLEYKLDSSSLTWTYVSLKLILQLVVASIGLSLPFIPQLKHRTSIVFKLSLIHI